MMSKDTDGAIKKFSTAVEIDPLCAEGFVGRGAALANQGKFDEAINDFKHCLTISPDHRNAKAYLSKCQVKKLEVDEEKRQAHEEAQKLQGKMLDSKTTRLEDKKIKDDGIYRSNAPEMYGPALPSKSASQSSISTHGSSRTDTMHKSKRKRRRKDETETESDREGGDRSRSRKTAFEEV
ncbi:hypothetical protein BC829DRAFT_434138 [Chytridium lagenaria]|nr:hypothetical protein BC829DRAFT_434138 [Chytridium lagenaria]